LLLFLTNFDKIYLKKRTKGVDQMKRAVQQIFERYPNVKKKIQGEETIPLTNIENVFYQLALFCNDPQTYSFDLSLFYKYLENDDLIFAIQTVIAFFQKDTYLIQDKKHFFINSDEIKNQKLYNQTMFAKYLSENGLNYSPNKLGVYYRRGKIPNPDLVINGTPYWFQSTVQMYLNEQINEKK
jgi:hypothetical protein